MVIGDVTRPETLPDAVTGIDAVVFTLGSDGAGKAWRRQLTPAAYAMCCTPWVRGRRASP